MSGGRDKTAASQGDLARRIMVAARGSSEDLAPLVHDRSEEVLRTLVSNPALAEEAMLILLARRDLPNDVLRDVASNPRRTASYQIRLALLRHSRTPASMTLRFIPQLHLFDLVAVSLLPYVPREVKTACEGAILAQVKHMPLGTRITLARRSASEQVMARLLVDAEPRVVEAALTNGRLAEGAIVRALRAVGVPPHTVDLISRSPRWSVRHDVRYGLLRSPHTPLARALGFLSTMTREDLALLVQDRAVPEQLRAYLTRMLATRQSRKTGGSGGTRWYT